jgi:hypothetical protein
LRCENIECNYCGKHKGCPFIYVEEFTLMTRLKVKKCREALGFLVQMEMDLLETIKQCQKKLVDEMVWGQSLP